MSVCVCVCGSIAEWWLAIMRITDADIAWCHLKYVNIHTILDQLFGFN